MTSALKDGRQPIIRLNNVKKTIKGKDIVKGLSFDVYPGEIFGFLGPNGAGKTTTIRMMVGLMSISDGDIEVGGTSVAKTPSKALQHVGAIVENPELYKFLTGYQNLVHFARMVPGVTQARIREVVELVGLENRIRDKVKTYSLGMRQRLGVAQALLHRPSVLILDEPTNGLDPAGIKELRDYLKKLAHEEGIAVIVSSHLLSEMELMCDRVAVIQNGALVEIQTLGQQEEQARQAAEVEFTVGGSDEALIQLSGLLAGMLAEATPTGFAAKLDNDQVAALNARLVHAGIKVYGITKRSKTLEDKFLEMTGGAIQ